MVNQPLDPPPDWRGAGPGEVRVEFPEAFLAEARSFVPDETHLYYFLRDGVELRLLGNWRRYLELGRDGYIASVDGYSGIPSLGLWFRAEDDGERGIALIFNRAVRAPEPYEEEDDS